MLIRINFLLGFGALTLIAFYFAGTYLVMLPLSLVAPTWAKPVAGIVVLAAFGLTVQGLAMAMERMAGIATYANFGLAAAVSQTAIVCGHVALAFGVAGFIAGTRLISEPRLLLIGALYLAGVAIAFQQWRARARRG